MTVMNMNTVSLGNITRTNKKEANYEFIKHCNTGTRSKL